MPTRTPVTGVSLSSMISRTRSAAASVRLMILRGIRLSLSSLDDDIWEMWSRKGGLSALGLQITSKLLSDPGAFPDGVEETHQERHLAEQQKVQVRNSA